MKNIKRIAVWSGPRNLSTALMRSFGARSDFEILDEPFYAAYLKKTGIQHPMFDTIISSQLSNYKEVADYCINGQVDKPYQYQKHMTHHMIKKYYKDFILSLNNVILIRKPELVLNSYKTMLTDCPYKTHYEKNKNTMTSQDYANTLIPTMRSWSETVFKTALQNRNDQEITKIVDDFYNSYQDEVASNPNDHAMDYIHIVMDIEKK